MASSKKLIESFQDTVNRCNSGKLYDLTQEAIKSTEVYDEGLSHWEPSTRLMKFGYIEIVDGTTFDVAKSYINNGVRVCVLNFANPHYPGGGVVNGAMAQEGCLCRSSNLYQCLTTKEAKENFYDYNIKNTDYFFSDKIIYSGKVTVFKDDSAVPVMMPEEDWFNVAVITSAAPYMAKCDNIDYVNLKEVFKKRIKNIFEVAFDMHIDTLILGAFGCGAFKNPPILVAQAFEETMKEYRWYFDNIIFAIKKTSNNCLNYNAFKEVFARYEKESEMEKIRQIQNNSFVNDKYSEEINNKISDRISRLEASISTLIGVNPQEYKVFLKQKNGDRQGIGIKGKYDIFEEPVIDYSIDIDKAFQVINQVFNQEGHKIFKVYDIELKKVCILEVFDKDIYKDKFLYTKDNKLVVLNKLDNEIFVDIYKIGYDNKYVYLVKEFIWEESLDTIVKNKGNLNIKQALNLALKICDGLEYLNNLKPRMIHGELSPEKIFIDCMYQVKLNYGLEIMDYIFTGNVKTIQNYNLSYSAPEQFYCQKYGDERSDIYSLGRVIYYALTGISSDKVIDTPIRRINKSVPIKLEKIIMKCIEPKPEDRYQSLKQLKKALSSYDSILNLF